MSVEDLAAPDGRGERSRYEIFYIPFILFCVNILYTADRTAFSVLMPGIKADLGLSDSQLGFLVGFAYSLFNAVCGIPIALLADRKARRTMLAVLLAIWSAMTALTGAAQTFWQVFAARVGVGVGEGGCLPTVQSLLSDCVPLTKRAKAFAINTFGLSVGTMAGLSISGALAEHIGWRLTFVALGAPGLILALVILLSVREPLRGRFDARATDLPKSLPSALVGLWRCRTYRMLVLYLIVMAFCLTGFHQWLPSFYVRSHHIPLSSVGVYIGVSVGAGSGIGLLIGGMLMSRVAEKDLRLPLRMGAVAVAISIPLSFLVLRLDSIPLSIALLFCTAVAGHIPNGQILATLYSVISPRVRATGGAVATFLQGIFGLGAGPFFVGVLSDHFAGRFGDEALRYALYVPTALLIVTVFLLYRSTGNLLDDLRQEGALPQ